MNQMQNQKTTNEQSSAQINKAEDYEQNQFDNFKNIINSKVQNFQKHLNSFVDLIQKVLYVQGWKVKDNDFFEEIILYCQPYLENRIDQCLKLIELQEQQILNQVQNSSLQKVKIPTCFDSQQHTKLLQNNKIEEIYPIQVNSQQNNEVSQFQSKLKQTIKQNQLSCSMIFNKSNTILISGSGEQIKLWKIKDGQIQLNPLILSGHTQLVTCLLYSDNERFFVSGSYDGNIRLWKKMQPSFWQSKPLLTHQLGVFGLLLNKINEQFISFGKDPQINIIQCNTNYELKIIQTLNKHQSIVDCMCINESESVLASTDNEKVIMIWVKDEKAKWQFKQIVNSSTNDFFSRMVFVNNYLICQQWSQPISQVFYEEDGYYKQRVDLQINLCEQISDDDLLFPTIYHKKTGILIQKYGNYVYILKLQKEFKFIQVCPPIDCLDPYNYGNLSEDGNLLSIWNDQTKEIRVYEMNIY